MCHFGMDTHCLFWSTTFSYIFEILVFDLNKKYMHTYVHTYICGCKICEFTKRHVMYGVEVCVAEN